MNLMMINEYNNKRYRNTFRYPQPPIMYNFIT